MKFGFSFFKRHLLMTLGIVGSFFCSLGFLSYLVTRNTTHHYAFTGPLASRGIYLINFGFLLIAVVLGTTLSMIILFMNLREKALLADSVLRQLQSGNLKARFPITRLDEFGEAMLRFNNMAEEIERLVESLKSSEKSRMRLLQELAHDLRTPVASLKSMLETISPDTGPVPESLRSEFISLSIKEVDYFEHLVEDLLFLAQATEPRYAPIARTIDLTGLLEAEVESRAESPVSANVNIDFKFDESIMIDGDPHLLRRLFRNALDNAASFAKSKVTVTLRRTGRTIECVIEDDGPGFASEALKEFGKRKAIRRVSNPSRRASIGLGSVIMSTIAQLHRGEIHAANREDERENIRGARVTIVLNTQFLNKPDLSLVFQN